MKTIKAFVKLLKGHELLVKEQRRIDSALFEIKCGILTLVVIALLLILFYGLGAFE